MPISIPVLPPWKNSTSTKGTQVGEEVDSAALRDR